MKFKVNKCAQFSSFLILLKKMWKKIRFKFEILDFFFKIPLLEKPFFSKKKCLRSRSKLAQMKFRENQCAQFSSFLILLKKCGKKSDSSFREKFYKGFPCKNIFLWKSFVK